MGEKLVQALAGPWAPRPGLALSPLLFLPAPHFPPTGLGLPMAVLLLGWPPWGPHGISMLPAKAAPPRAPGLSPPSPSPRGFALDPCVAIHTSPPWDTVPGHGHPLSSCSVAPVTWTLHVSMTCLHSCFLLPQEPQETRACVPLTQHSCPHLRGGHICGGQRCVPRWNERAQ